MAFILSNGGCNPLWDGSRPLTGGVDQQTINTIRAAGGNVAVSFGGWRATSSAQLLHATALAGAVQQVINAYGRGRSTSTSRTPTSSRTPPSQDRILDALKIVKPNNPNVDRPSRSAPAPAARAAGTG